MRRRNEGIIALLMILALIAFVVGSAIGIMVSIEQHENATSNNNTSHVENVTVQMVNNNSGSNVANNPQGENVSSNNNLTT
ncbi:MAG: hypothetical protein K6A34_01270 [Methanobrevibacter sp.]|nr:hypothetical protein [Methanobrevibacter sp.]